MINTIIFNTHIQYQLISKQVFESIIKRYMETMATKQKMHRKVLGNDTNSDSDTQEKEKEKLFDKQPENNRTLFDQSSDNNNTYLRNDNVNKNRHQVNDEITESPVAVPVPFLDKTDPEFDEILRNENKPSRLNTFTEYFTSKPKDNTKDNTSNNKNLPLIVEENETTLTPDAIRKQVEKQANEYLGEIETKKIIEQYTGSPTGNLFTTEMNRIDNPIIVPDIRMNISPQIFVMDNAIKLAVKQLEELSTRFGIQLEKSTELTNKWESIKTKLDVYIKSLSKVNYKKALTYAGCTLGIVYMIYQMGLYRKIPDFLLSIANNIPIPKFTSEVPIPKPSESTSLNELVNIPLTPLTIITGVGSIVSMLGLLKISLWVIRKLKK